MEIAEIEKQKEEKKKKKKKGVIAGVVLATSLAVTAGVTGAVLSRGGRKEEYYIYFNVGESTIEKISNTDIEIPQAPTQAGYEFEGWYEGDSDTPFDFENPPLDRNVTLTARYAKLFKVTYNLNDGSEAQTKTYKVGEDVTLMTPTRAGYVFGGWYEKEDFSGESVTTISKDTDLSGGGFLYTQIGLKHLCIQMIQGRRLQIPLMQDIMLLDWRFLTL